MDGSDHIKLIDLLWKAEKLAGQFSGGYSGQFLSAEEFHLALKESISALEKGDMTQLGKLSVWFAPTSSWDDFIGGEGVDLANEIEVLLSRLAKTSRTKPIKPPHPNE